MRSFRLIGCLTMLAAVGCSRDPKLIPVTGTVTLNGKPVDGVRVYFWPKEIKPKMSVNTFAIGFSDKEGKYSLRGTNGDGVGAGEYKVTFARPMAPAGKPPVKPNAKPEEVEAKETLPDEITKLALTPYTATVSEASHDFTFELSSKR
jgi:hypothetical protein